MTGGRRAGRGPADQGLPGGQILIEAMLWVFVIFGSVLLVSRIFRNEYVSYRRTLQSSPVYRR
jgi:hypothetical protein